MGLHLRKYSTGLPAWAYIYENIQQGCLHLRKYSTELPAWAYIYENIQQGCLHRISQGIFNLD